MTVLQSLALVKTVGNRWKTILIILGKWDQSFHRDKFNPHKELRSYYFRKVLPMLCGENRTKASSVEEKQYTAEIEKILKEDAKVFDLYKQQTALKYDDLYRCYIELMKPTPEPDPETASLLESQAIALSLQEESNGGQ